MRTDVHQHLWPVALITALRRRSTPPMLRDWTLHTHGEPPYEVRPEDHDPAQRARLDEGTRVLLSLSTPLGLEALPAAEGRPLLDAWHDGASTLPEPFGAWAAVSEAEPDLALLEQHLDAGFVGLQVSAGLLASPARVRAAAPLLAVCEAAGRPVLVHPGPAMSVDGSGSDEPAWWAPVVDYVGQLQRGWWAWHAVGRSLLPSLRICFVAGAGLAPLHHERFAARSGERFVLDQDVFVDTSSYRRQAVDALTRALGIDVIVLGSDRPYAEPAVLDLGIAAEHAICDVNPTRLLEGSTA